MNKTLLTIAAVSLFAVSLNQPTIQAQTARPGYEGMNLPEVTWLNAAPPTAESINTTPGKNGGTGTETDPYIVSSPADLLEIANCVNNSTEAQSTVFPNGNTGYANQYFMMDCDIDLSEFMPWIGISVPGQKIFYGHFDGNNHVIKHMTTDESKDNQGLFTVIGNGASVSNLSITDSRISGMQYVGAIVGAAGENSIISNCHNYSDVNGGWYYVGGIAGASWGSIIACSNNGNVCNNTDFVSGIVGDFYGTMTDCVNTGDITGTTSTAGCIGYSCNAETTRCINAGNIYGSSGYTGGVVGFLTNYNSENNTSYLLNYGNAFGPNIRAVIGRLWKEGDAESHANNCYYDCQMTDKKGTNPGNDVEGVVEPRYTHEMIGDNLAELIGEGWQFTEGIYPRPSIVSEEPTTIIAATPIYLRFKSEDEFDRFDGVRDDFDVYSAEDISWNCNEGLVAFEDGLATLQGLGEETLTLTWNAAGNDSKYANKQVHITITEMLGILEAGSTTEIALYPNPASDHVFIGSENTTTTFYSLDGKVVGTSSEQTIDLSQTESGTYILVFSKDGRIVGCQRLTVNK